MLTQNRRCLSLFWQTLFCLFSAQLFLLKHNFSICWNYFDFLLNIYSMLIKSVTVAQKCSVKKVFLKISRVQWVIKTTKKNFALRICGQICSFLQIGSHLLKKCLMKNFILGETTSREKITTANAGVIFEIFLKGSIFSS